MSKGPKRLASFACAAIILFSLSIFGTVAETLPPEVSVKNTPLDGSPQKRAFNDALNRMGFKTRHPESDDMSLFYTDVGGYKLTMDRFSYALKAQSSECKRISAYADADFKGHCQAILVAGMNNFSKMKNDNKISDLAKRTALGQATYGGLIDFDHAARLAFMHSKICQQQGNRGYVPMDTLAVPCSGMGDVLDAGVAERLGLIN